MDREATERASLIALVVLAAAAGVAVRVLHLFGEPLWLDEAYSAYAAAKGFGFLWHVVPSYETHPPFYYSLLRLWSLAFGDGLPALRSLGLVAGLLTPPMLGWAAHAFSRWLELDVRRARRLVAISLVFASLAIPLVEMSREVRPYPVMILLYAAALRALAGIAIRRRAGQPLIGAAYVAYLVILALELWLHNLGPLWGAALGLGCLSATVRRGTRPRDWAWLVGGHMGVALVYLPALLILLDQAPTWVASTWVTFSLANAGTRLLALYAVPGWQSGAGLVLAVLGAIGLWRRGAEARRMLAMLLIAGALPVLLSVLLSMTVAPVFIARTLTPIAVPTALLMAIGIVLSQGRAAWVAIAAAAMLAANQLAVDWQTRHAGPMQDWYGTLDWLQPRFRAGDRILAYPNEGALPMKRAIDDRRLGWPVDPIPDPIPSAEPSGWHPTGSRGVVSLPPWRLHQIADDPKLQAIPTIWLLRLGAKTYDPGDVFLHELSRGRHVVRSWTDGPIEIVGLAR